MVRYRTQSLTRENTLYDGELAGNSHTLDHVVGGTDRDENLWIPPAEIPPFHRCDFRVISIAVLLET